MDELTEGTPSEGISRRSVIKRAGVVGAAAWTAPVLSSLGAKAFAGTPAACANCAPCEANFCGAACSCLCEEGTGDSFCHQGSSCADLTPCTTSADCRDGWACAHSCCDFAGFGALCHPPCNSPDAGAVAAGAGPNSIR